MVRVDLIKEYLYLDSDSEGKSNFSETIVITDFPSHSARTVERSRNGIPVESNVSDVQRILLPVYWILTG